MAYDAYLQIAEIKGDSTDGKHKDWIEVLAFTFGVSQSGGGSHSGSGGFTGGRADFSDLTITKRLDSSSPNLQLFCAKGSYISEMVLEVCRATGEKTCFYKMTLNNVIVSSYAPSGASGGDLLPNESVSFRFDKIAVEYTHTDPKTGAAGSTFKSNWSTTDNQPF